MGISNNSNSRKHSSPISENNTETAASKLVKWGSILSAWLVLILSTPILDYFKIKVSLPLLISIPVLITASLLGIVGGLLAGLVATPLNLLLHYVFHSTINDFNIIQLILSTISYCLIGLVAGRLHDLRKKLKLEVLKQQNEINLRKEMEKALRESEQNYRALFELEADAVFIIQNQDGAILEANNVACGLYGYSRDELLNLKNTELSAEPEETQAATLRTVPIEQVVNIPLRWHRKKDGTVFPVEITARFINWKGRSVHIAAIRDITERRMAEQKLERLAITDPLTGLLNRRHFFEKSIELFTRALHQPYELSILMIDLDHFKKVNDRYGHAAGDETLQEVARRLHENVRPTDVVGRYGGEEFAIILPRTDRDETHRIANRLIAATADKPVSVENATISITISIGIAGLDETVSSLDELLQRADQALYQAKKDGRNRWTEWQYPASA